MATDQRRVRVIAGAIAGVIGSFVFVALNGAGMAQNAIAPAQDQDGKSAEQQSGEKIVICHKAKNTISVSVNAWPAHQRHADTEGVCVEAATTRSAKPKQGKKVAIAATTATTTKKGPESAKTKKAKSTSSAATTTSDSGVTQSATTQKSKKKSKAQKSKKAHKAGGKPTATTSPAGPMTSPEPEQDDGPGNGHENGNGNGKSNGK